MRFISKSLIVAAVLLIGYAAAVALLPAPTLPVSYEKRNYIKAQNYVTAEEAPRVVVVGSSVSAGFEELPEDWYNLAMQGDSALTGLAIVARTELKPDMVLVETNILSRGVDREKLERLFHPVAGPLRKKAPVFRVGNEPSRMAWYIPWASRQTIKRVFGRTTSEPREDAAERQSGRTVERRGTTEDAEGRGRNAEQQKRRAAGFTEGNEEYEAPNAKHQAPSTKHREQAGAAERQRPRTNRPTDQQSNKRRTTHDDTTPQITDEVTDRLIAERLKEAQELLPADKVSGRICVADQLVTELQAQGIEVIFYEVPEHPAVYGTPRKQQIREAWRSMFPPTEFRWFEMPDPSKYQTNDGRHLTWESARRFQEYLTTTLTH